jgi:hypothetical protein
MLNDEIKKNQLKKKTQKNQSSEVGLTRQTHKLGYETGKIS